MHLLTWKQLPLTKLLLVNYEFTHFLHTCVRLPYHTMHCSWISTKHDCLDVGLLAANNNDVLKNNSSHPQRNSTITGWDWWTPLLSYNPEVAALQSAATNMISTFTSLLSSVCPVSTCTPLHSYQQSVTSNVLRTCIGLHYVYAYVTHGLCATFVRLIIANVLEI